MAAFRYGLVVATLFCHGIGAAIWSKRISLRLGVGKRGESHAIDGDADTFEQLGSSGRVSISEASAALANEIEIYRQGTNNTKIVYTVITGGYVEPCYIDKRAREQSIDRILVTDNASLHGTSLKGWHVVVAHAVIPQDDPQLFSRVLKMQPHMFLNGYEKSLYIDGNVEVTAPLSDLFERVGNGLGDDAGKPPAEMAVYSFPRNVIEEAAWVEDYAVKMKWLSRDDARAQTQAQAFRYAAMHPDLLEENPGTFYGKIILRRKTDRMVKFAETWFDEFRNGVHRDQLSFQFSALETNVTVSMLNRECFETCKPYNDPGFTRWFKKHRETKHVTHVHS